MLALKPFRDRRRGVSDLLNYAALIDEGIVLNKDGSLMAGWFYAGPDTASSSEATQNYLAERMNAALVTLGSGWVSWTELIRMESVKYPAASESYFPDEVSRWIDEERRQQFEAEGEHYENVHAVIVQYTPPRLVESKFVSLLYSDDGKSTESVADRILNGFKKDLRDLENVLSPVVRMRRMGSFTVDGDDGASHMQDELMNFLQFCLTGELGGVNIPPIPMYLDCLLGGKDLHRADFPLYGEDYLAMISVQGFPLESAPGILNHLSLLPFSYRWSNRMIYLEGHQAVKEIKKYKRKWSQKVTGLVQQVFKTSGGQVDQDALLMSKQADAALSDANSGLVRFGFYTPVIVLRHKNPVELKARADSVLQILQRLGFAGQVETINSLEAWLGSLPGHPIPNIRRPPFHTLNLAHFFPLSSVWPGRDQAPCPLYKPRGQPALLHAATTGMTPFRLNLHVDDLGHTLILGPTGAGKSTLLATTAMQFRRYNGAKITVFDKGMSMWAPCKAAGGSHYEITLGADGPGLAPLSHLDTEEDVAWAESWLATCFELQAQKRLSPLQVNEVRRALQSMKEEAPVHARTITDFCATVQDREIRLVLKAYTLDGSTGRLLDSRQDSLGESDFTVFEIDKLRELGDKVAIPTLLYLFRRFEKSLTGKPALLILDEAWLMLAHPVFREKIREWLKTLRKANCAVVMATQSLADAVNSGILDVLQESCATKIYLPNEEAANEGRNGVQGPADFYRAFGLNETEIEVIRTAVKKRHYYYVSPEGRRLFDLGLGPVALSFVAASDKETRAHLVDLERRHGSKWPRVWLNENGVSDERLAA